MRTEMMNKHRTLGDLEATSTLSIVLSFLSWKEILFARVNRNWREAARFATVPQTIKDIENGWFVSELYVQNRDVANALKWISRALPNMPLVSFNFYFDSTEEFEIADGDNPQPSIAPSLRIDYPAFGMTAPKTPPPIDLRDSLENFHGLRHLIIEGAKLNGRYPFLFLFPQLESLELVWAGRIQWNLSDLENLPNLKKMRVVGTKCTGSLGSLRKLRGTLEELSMAECKEVHGSIHDLADFPHLRVLSVSTNMPGVIGDIRNISETDFLSIQKLDLGEGVYGGNREMGRIRDAEPLMMARYRLMKKRCFTLFENRRWRLSEDSEDYFTFNGHYSRQPPFLVEFVRAGPRIGWRWTAVTGESCEVRWLDPQPSPPDPDFERYTEEKSRYDRDVFLFRGYFEPLTAPQHEELCDSAPFNPGGALPGGGYERW